LIDTYAQAQTGGQSHLDSAIEAVAGTVTGFVLSMILQRALFPALGHNFGFGENLLIATAFTLLSVARSYWMRRLFNWLGLRHATTVAGRET
jgi:hypothetical protein